MSHTMKLWERIIEHRSKRVTNVTENQFRFMSGRSTMEAILLMRQLMERWWRGGPGGRSLSLPRVDLAHVSLHVERHLGLVEVVGEVLALSGED
jgi:hypothetical protein